MTFGLPDLDAAASTLLDPSAGIGELHRQCAGLHAGLLALVPSLPERPMALDAGLALSPADAARCLLDLLRTARLLQAVDAAIDERFGAGSRGVLVLYAGCGPLAPLALLLARRWRERPLRFVLVDVHEASLAAARRLFEWAGVAGMLQACLQADAASLRLPSGLAPDVLVVEVMQRALAREPQLAVLANLLPQCPSDLRLVPHRIRIEAWLTRLAREFDPTEPRERHALGSLLELSRSSVPEFADLLARGAQSLPPIRLRVPGDLPVGLHLMLRTRIETAPGVELADYDSGLSYPQIVHELGTIQPGESLRFEYRLGGEPGFRVSRDATRPGAG